MSAAAGNLHASPLRDWAEVRADFPILGRRVNGKPLIYFDNANTAQKPRFRPFVAKAIMASLASDSPAPFSGAKVWASSTITRSK